jgi:hypothetical protein
LTLNDSSEVVNVSYNSNTFVLDIFYANGNHLQSMKLSDSM